MARRTKARFMYFLQMRCEFGVNLTTQLCFRCDIRKRVEHNLTLANYLLQICDVNIYFAFAGSMNRGLRYGLNLIRSNFRTVQNHRVKLDRVEPWVKSFKWPLYQNGVMINFSGMLHFKMSTVSKRLHIISIFPKQTECGSCDSPPECPPDTAERVTNT